MLPPIELANARYLRVPREYGAAERTRTSDLLITNQLLYHLSYCSTGTDVMASRAQPAAAQATPWAERRQRYPRPPPEARAA